MAEELTMPRLSDTMDEGTISKWLKHEGDTIARGEPVAEIETDKANMEFNSYLDGVLTKIVVQEGESAPLGAVIAYVGAAEEGAPSTSGQMTKSAEGDTVTDAAKPQSPALYSAGVPAPVRTIAEAGGDSQGDHVKASPLARRMASEHHLDLAQVKGTGPGGRVVREDVEAAIALVSKASSSAPAVPVGMASAPPVAAETKSLTGMQKVIAKRMLESKSTVPHFYVTLEIAMDQAMQLRALMNDGVDKGQDVTVNSMIVRAVALALEQHPYANGSYRGDHFEFHEQINVGVAVAVEHGLVVPVVRDCNKKSLRQIDKDVRGLVAKAREGKLSVTDLEGHTFSVSNLGMFDVEEFQAIVNPPDAAILAVGVVKDIPVVVNGQVTVGKRMRMTLSADHRILYGAPAAQFVQEIKRLLEHPARLAS